MARPSCLAIKLWLKEGKLVNWQQSHGLIDACGEGRLACVVRSNRATEAQIAEKVHAGSHKKVRAHSAWQLVGSVAADQSGPACATVRETGSELDWLYFR